jgi:hypothetical protein
METIQINVSKQAINEVDIGDDIFVVQDNKELLKRV